MVFDWQICEGTRDYIKISYSTLRTITLRILVEHLSGERATLGSKYSAVIEELVFTLRIGGYISAKLSPETFY